ncbi:variable surface lipoprotein [Mycoplasma buteonis]|uniref:variable surface lipoprotein n=1 Tax=Mycoplasma buteonis TaxID=171280 RepID=UPI0005695104|nr:variable surface lipoprotein [Mycoplasma buteonis]
MKFKKLLILGATTTMLPLVAASCQTTKNEQTQEQKDLRSVIDLAKLKLTVSNWSNEHKDTLRKGIADALAILSKKDASKEELTKAKEDLNNLYTTVIPNQVKEQKNEENKKLNEANKSKVQEEFNSDKEKFAYENKIKSWADVLSRPETFFLSQNDRKTLYKILYRKEMDLTKKNVVTVYYDFRKGRVQVQLQDSSQPNSKGYFKKLGAVKSEMIAPQLVTNEVMDKKEEKKFNLASESQANNHYSTGNPDNTLDYTFDFYTKQFTLIFKAAYREAKDNYSVYGKADGEAYKVKFDLSDEAQYFDENKAELDAPLQLPREAYGAYLDVKTFYDQDKRKELAKALNSLTDEQKSKLRMQYMFKQQTLMLRVEKDKKFAFSSKAGTLPKNIQLGNVKSKESSKYPNSNVDLKLDGNKVIITYGLFDVTDKSKWTQIEDNDKKEFKFELDLTKEFEDLKEEERVAKEETLGQINAKVTEAKELLAKLGSEDTYATDKETLTAKIAEAQEGNEELNSVELKAKLTELEKNVAAVNTKYEQHEQEKQASKDAETPSENNEKDGAGSSDSVASGEADGAEEHQADQPSGTAGDDQNKPSSDVSGSAEDSEPKAKGEEEDKTSSVDGSSSDSQSDPAPSAEKQVSPGSPEEKSGTETDSNNQQGDPKQSGSEEESPKVTEPEEKTEVSEEKNKSEPGADSVEDTSSTQQGETNSEDPKPASSETKQKDSGVESESKTEETTVPGSGEEQQPPVAEETAPEGKQTTQEGDGTPAASPAAEGETAEKQNPSPATAETEDSGSNSRG